MVNSLRASMMTVNVKGERKKSLGFLTKMLEMLISVMDVLSCDFLSVKNLIVEILYSN